MAHPGKAVIGKGSSPFAEIDDECSGGKNGESDDEYHQKSLQVALLFVITIRRSRRNGYFPIPLPVPQAYRSPI